MVFPEIKNTNYNRNIQNISFLDFKGRMMVLLFINKKEDLKQAMEKLSKHQKIDQRNPVQY